MQVRTVDGKDDHARDCFVPGQNGWRTRPAGAALGTGAVPVAINQDGTPNSESNPAARGTIAGFYGTGEGLTDGPTCPAFPTMPVRPPAPSGAPDHCQRIARQSSTPGGAPGLTGILQLDARVPGGYVPPGPVAVQLEIGSFTAAPPITIWVK